MIFGYARVSTEDQITDRQIDALTAYGCDEIFEEKISGTERSRPQLDALLAKLRQGDKLVVYELKRLGRNTRQLLELAEWFEKMGVEFVSLTEQIDTTTPMGRFVFTTWCALAQLDRDIIAENTKSGLAAARARGRMGGRPRKDPKKVEMALKMYASGEYSMKEIAEATDMSKSAIRIYAREYGVSKKGKEPKVKDPDEVRRSTQQYQRDYYLGNRDKIAAQRKAKREAEKQQKEEVKKA